MSDLTTARALSAGRRASEDGHEADGAESPTVVHGAVAVLAAVVPVDEDRVAAAWLDRPRMLAPDLERDGLAGAVHDLVADDGAARVAGHAVAHQLVLGDHDLGRGERHPDAVDDARLG